jgi:hypothetical protein
MNEEKTTIDGKNRGADGTGMTSTRRILKPHCNVLSC